MLAGISIDYYTRIERGNLSNASESVLRSVAEVLRLDDAEQQYLLDLARHSTTPRRTRRKPTRGGARPGIQRVLDALTGAPAWVQNDRLDLLAANALGRALNHDLVQPAHPVNLARFLFLDPRAREVFPDWERHADDAVAILRSAAGRVPYDTSLSNLIGELCTRSDDFRVTWGAHNVRFHNRGVKKINHPVVGELELSYEGFGLPADRGLTLFVLTAERDSTSEERLKILASWAASESNRDAE